MTIPDYLIPDPEWEQAKARLWNMTVDERIAAMRSGHLSLRLCAHWAAHAPDEIPLINGEFEYLARLTPEVAEATPRAVRGAR